MRIEQAGGPHRRLTARTRGIQTGFALPDEGAAEPALEHAQDSQAAAPPAALGPLLAALAAPAPHTDAQTNQAATLHGHAMLDALAGLQLATLAPDSGQARSTLAALAQGAQDAADPGLNAVLQAIAARAAVALARSGGGPA